MSIISGMQREYAISLLLRGMHAFNIHAGLKELALVVSDVSAGVFGGWGLTFVGCWRSGVMCF